MQKFLRSRGKSLSSLSYLGGLGVRSGPRVSSAAYWSSWADCLVTTAKRQPAVAEQSVAALTNGNTRIVSRRSWRLSTHVVGGVVFTLQGWRDFVSDHPPRPGHNNMDGEPGSRRGWQVVSLDVSGGSVREHKFVATPHAPVPRPVPFPRRPVGKCALYQLPKSPPQPGLTLSRSECSLQRRLWLSLHSTARAHSTLVATTVQRALWRGFWDVGGSQWKVRPHGFVARQRPECR